MITGTVEYRCDWKGCGNVDHRETDLSDVIRVAPIATGPPRDWVRVDERIYCPLHQVVIRPREAGERSRWRELFQEA